MKYLFFTLLTVLILLVAGCTNTQSSIANVPTPSPISTFDISAPISSQTSIQDPILAFCQVRSTPYSNSNLASFDTLPPSDEMFDFNCNGHMILRANIVNEGTGLLTMVTPASNSSFSAICPDGTIVQATPVKGCEQVINQWSSLYTSTDGNQLVENAISVNSVGRVHVAPEGSYPAIKIDQMPPNNPQIVYWNDTVDLSLLEGPSGIITRFPGEECVDISSFSHKIFIDPSIFPAGIWYQWSIDGDYAAGNRYSGGNIPVFEVIAGNRPLMAKTP